MGRRSPGRHPQTMNQSANTAQTHSDLRSKCAYEFARIEGCLAQVIDNAETTIGAVRGLHGPVGALIEFDPVSQANQQFEHSNVIDQEHFLEPPVEVLQYDGTLMALVGPHADQSLRRKAYPRPAVVFRS